MKNDNGITIIIGAGPTGLGFAYKYTGDYILLEAEDKLGGLCRSFQFNNSVFDIGGHSFHTPHPDIKDSVEQIFCKINGLFWDQRDAKVAWDDHLIPYPFQKNFESLKNSQVIEECKNGLNEINKNNDPVHSKDLKGHLIGKFGEGIYKHFLKPYNEKLWCCELEHISGQWVKERIPDTQMINETFCTKSGKRTPLQSDTLIGYPMQGGYEEIFLNMEPLLKDIRYNHKVKRIDCKNKILFTENGEQFIYDRIISTIPIVELIKIIDPVINDLENNSSRLEYTSLHLTCLLTEQLSQNIPHRIYIHTDEVPHHKISFNHRSSPWLANRGVFPIIGETSYTNGSLPGNKIEEDLITYLHKLGILNNPEDISQVESRTFKYAYPIQKHDTRSIVNEFKDILENNNIYSAGRFGEWKYINSDECLKIGFNLAEGFNNH